jgi:hypothetical protein
MEDGMARWRISPSSPRAKERRLQRDQANGRAQQIDKSAVLFGQPPISERERPRQIALPIADERTSAISFSSHRQLSPPDLTTPAKGHA